VKIQYANTRNSEDASSTMSAVHAPAVLYVEDEGIIREMSGLVLEDAGFDVVMAANGTAAIDALDGNADPFCAIVTDINLGSGPDGWEVARRARELNEALPVVYVTGGSAHQWKTKGVANSVLIAKPFNPTQLVVAISALLEKMDTNRSH
jgi:DNA-binding response OmpR family regulator